MRTKPTKQARGRETYNRLLPAIKLINNFVAKLPKRAQLQLLQFNQNSNSKFSRLIRFAAVKNIAQSCGEMVDIHSQCQMLNPQSLTLGNRVSIHPVCYIEAAGGLSIGNDVSIAHHTTIMSTTHTWHDPLVPIRDQKIDKRPTKIADNVWIGAGVRIMAGITIGSGSIIAAGAVVTKDIPENSIAAGVPARVIKQVYS